MIISPPFLPTPIPDDEAFVRDAMPDSIDIAPGSGGAPLGSYPLTTALTWHNGLHVSAPRDPQGPATQASAAPTRQYLPVRAIADGIVIFKRAPKSANTTATDPQNYNPYGNTPAWTDNGIVILKHTTDIGATGTTPTSVTYYSVYMHLSHIESTVSEGQSIWRKDTIGTAGKILGRDNQIHFEICLSPAELQKLVGTNRPITWSDPATAPTAHGRTDAVFGALYVYLPAGTPTSTTTPTTHLQAGGATGGASAATGQFVPNTLTQAQWVEIRYERGSATVSSYRATASATPRTEVGDPIGQPHPEPDAEYNLYTEANTRHTSAVAAGATSSSPSGWYELLRFGRNLGSDALPGNAAHWRQIPTANGVVWADLNATGTYKFSDADFPAFKGWNCFDDDDSPDNQRCDSIQLKRAIRDPQVPESIRERVALAARLGDDKVRDKLKRAICKFPTEWDKGTIVQRYDWLKVDEEFNISEGKEWDEFKAHAESISFDGLPQDYKDAVWHVHPRTFISHMRQCGWLSRNEMVQLLPMNSLRKDGNSWAWENVTLSGATGLLNETDAAAIERRVELNKSLRKYCVTNKIRLACFFGNATQETQWYQKFHENSPYWYKPWDGRGFLQLTHADNYIKFWDFRGISVNAATKTSLRNKTALANANRNGGMTDLTNSLSDTSTGIPQNIINLRETVGTEAHSRAHSAGAYWAWSGASAQADGNSTTNSPQQKNTNAGIKHYYENSAFGNVAATVNLGHPSTSFASIWGIQARFMAFANAQVILLDKTNYLQSSGQARELPEDFSYRRP
ncbi:MAG: M23 family metallopeptidase [Alcaligenaceae bacterium]|nr:MAG: M23 family metallopeptidase [Alcaligenaceae bacterium]